MKIKKLSIKNFKSLIDIEINEPEQFTVFVGPNGSGKSNIFEAIQLAVLPKRFGSSPESNNEWINVFGGYESIKPKIQYDGNLTISYFDDHENGYVFSNSYTKNKSHENISVQVWELGFHIPLVTYRRYLKIVEDCSLDIKKYKKPQNQHQAF